MRMNYFVVGTNDMTAATKFYDALFEGQGLTQIPASERMTYWMGDDFAFAVAIPFDEAPATIGNGTMVGFSFGSADEVTRLHAKALELGGTSEGEPGQRGPMFSAYLRDLDGNKICLSD
ncbi:VOC family protein [Aliiroseovarius subalbicans]|uniref:VOC family protein n=1 Tax=Aliiroseovarius subalbicans TaxID=2925840 RepID=UPI001F59074E|nr:VOC family protein [Aliiroseovarius subalbicans]MCI2399829.1 VOC family protein [Aliiroseovarius subalbicans]